MTRQSVDWDYEEKSGVAIQTRHTVLKASIGSKAGPMLFRAADCGKSSCSLLPPWPDQCDFASVSRPQWIASGVVNIPTNWSKCKVFRSKCAPIGNLTVLKYLRRFTLESWGRPGCEHTVRLRMQGEVPLIVMPARYVAWLPLLVFSTSFAKSWLIDFGVTPVSSLL